MTGYCDSHDSAPADDTEQPATEHGMSRRQLLRHAGWFGGAVVLTMASGEVISHIADSRETNSMAAAGATAAANSSLRFVQVSDSHIGFQGPANTDVAAHSPKRSTRSTRSDSDPTSSCTAAT